MYKKRLLLLLVLVVLNTLIWYGVFVEGKSGDLTIAFLDVGQGDAIFVEGPTGIQVLIDGGRGKGVLRELGKLMPFYDRTIDVLIATHPDSDHIGGLSDVLESFEVEYVFEPGVSSDTGIYKEFVRLSKEEKAEVFLARRGHILDIGGGAYIRVLFPDRDTSNFDTNNASIIVQIVYGDIEVLLTGDSPKEIEEYVLALEGPTIESDVLKVGHHGSNTSSSERFVGVVDPEYAVISAGINNRYGHPHIEVLDVFENSGVEILETYEIGSIVFETDGKFLRRIK